VSNQDAAKAIYKLNGATRRIFLMCVALVVFSIQFLLPWDASSWHRFWRSIGAGVFVISEPSRYRFRRDGTIQGFALDAEFCPRLYGDWGSRAIGLFHAVLTPRSQRSARRVVPIWSRRFGCACIPHGRCTRRVHFWNSTLPSRKADRPNTNEIDAC